MTAAKYEKEKLGRSIKTCRKARNMSQSQLAERLWIDRSSLSSYEIGKRTPDIYMLCRIADELDLPLDVLVGRKELEDYVETECLFTDKVTLEKMERKEMR